MNARSVLPAVLWALLLHSPVILVSLTGLLVVLVKWNSLRNSARPALAGCALISLLSISNPILATLIPSMLQGRSPGEIRWLYALVGATSSLGWAAALSLLLFAILAGRFNAAPALPA